MRRNPGAVAAIVVGLAVVLGAVIVSAGRSPDPEVSANILVNPPGLITVNNSPSLARHPGRPDHLVISHRIDRPGFSALLEWSDDGGTSWHPTTLPLPAAVPPCAASPERLACPFAPSAAFGPDGTLFVAYVSLQGTGNSPGALWVSTSADGGRTLAPPVQVAGALTFQPRLAVGADGTVHLTWLQAAGVGLNRLVGQAGIVTARSADGGASFSPPVRVSDPERERVGAASPVVDASGELVVLYQDYKGDRRDFEGLEGPPVEGPFALVVTRSTDGGRSFSPGREVESGVVPTKRFLVFLPEFPSIAAGPEGSLQVAWYDGRNGDEDVFTRHSPDGGRTWTEAERVNDNPVGDGSDQYLPHVSIAPGGRVDVVFYDRRGDPANVATDAYLATSVDGQSPFSNLRLSSQSFDSRVGPTFGLEDYGADFGTRLGLDSTDDGAYASWTDTRLGDENTGRQDVFGAAVTGLGPPGIAGSAGLGAAVALALGVVVLAWFIVRRSTTRSKARSRP